MTITLLRKRKSAIRQGLDLLRKLGDRANVFIPGVGQPVGPVNLLLYSNSIANAAWSKTGATATDGASDPWGGTTACVVTDPAATNGYFNQSITDPSPAGKTYTLGLWLKAGTKPGAIRVRLTDSTLVYGGQVDITPTGAWTFYTYQTTFAAGSPANVRVTIDPIDNTTAGNYYVCSVGLFLGAYTDSQLLALGGVPSTTTAAAAASYLPWITGTSLSPTGGVQSIGPELIPNGDFSNGTTNWTLYQPTAGVVQAEAGGVRIRTTDASFAAIQAALLLSAASTYRVTFTIKNWVAGRVQVSVDGTNPAYNSLAANGTYTFDVVASGACVVQIKRYGGESCNLIIDDVSCKLLTTTPSSAWLADYVESGATTVGAIDGPIGFLSDGMGVVGPALARSGLGLNGNTDNGDGTFTALASTGNAIRIYFGLGDLVQGASYLITLNILSPGTITADWCDVTSSATVLPVTPGRSVTFISSRSSYDATYRFLDVLSNSGNVRFSYSVQQITGKHAAQATGTNKPTMRRGVVNQLLYSTLAGTLGAGQTPNFWSATGNSGATPLTITNDGPGGTFAVGIRITPSAGLQGLQRSANAIDGILVGVPYTIGCYMRVPTGLTAAALTLYTGSGVPATPTVVSAATLAAQPKDTWVLQTAVITFATIPSILAFCANGASGTGLDIACPFVIPGAFTTAQIQQCGGAALTTGLAVSSASGNFGIECDGAKYLSLPSVPFQMGDDHTVIAGCRGDSSSADRTAFGIRSSVASTPVVGQLGFASGAPDAEWRGDDGFLYRATSAGGAQLGQYLVLALRKQAASGALFVNGALAASVAVPSGTTTVNTATLGGVLANGSAGNLLVGMLYAIVIVKGVLSDAEFLILRRFVGALTGPIGVKF